MDGKKKLAGWLALTVIALVAAVALATTNLMTEKPIAEQNLGENQQALKAMFPEADEFAELSPGESSGVDFVYEVKQGGQTIGYAVKETVQGYGGAIEVLTGMETGGTLRGISVGGPDFKETEGLGARAKEPEFTDQFAGKTPPLKLGENIDGISGATVTSRAVVDGVNQGVGKVQSLTGSEMGGNGAACPGGKRQRHRLRRARAGAGTAERRRSHRIAERGRGTVCRDGRRRQQGERRELHPPVCGQNAALGAGQGYRRYFRRDGFFTGRGGRGQSGGGIFGKITRSSTNKAKF